MGGELLGDSYSLKNDGVGDTETEKPTPTYTEIFYQCLPYYLSMGMSADEFWNCDPRMYKVYREKDRISTEKENERLWLQGAYVYQAILLAAPRLNSIQPKDPLPYPTKPLDLGLGKPKEESDEMTDDEIKKTPEYVKMIDFMNANNKRFKGKKDA